MSEVRQHFVAGLRELAELARTVGEQLGPELDAALEMVRGTVAAGGTLFFCGNGGSAADAQHMATEYVVRYMRSRRAYPAVALTTDTSLLTAAGNDFGFDHIFSRQVEALARPGDLLDHPLDERELAERAARGRGGARQGREGAGVQRARRRRAATRSPICRSSFRRAGPIARRSCISVSNT